MYSIKELWQKILGSPPSSPAGVPPRELRRLRVATAEAYVPRHEHALVAAAAESGKNEQGGVGQGGRGAQAADAAGAHVVPGGRDVRASGLSAGLTCISMHIAYA